MSRAAILVWAALLTYLPTPLGAQTVRPLIDELGNPAKGRVEYVNDADTPLNVVIEARSFTVSETGELSYRPLDSNIRLKLSATSFRILPKQTYYLFYEATSDATPAWFVIYAAFSGFAVRGPQGVNVRLQLPHTVYLLPKSGLNQSDVQVTTARYNPETRRLVIEVTNSGPNFGRAQQALLIGRKKMEGAGFPLFPHSRRRMEYGWEGDGAPQRIQLQFDRFKVECEIKGDG
jgi:hypothetical protein